MKTVKNLQTQVKSQLKQEKSTSSTQLKKYLKDIGIQIESISDSLTDEEYEKALSFVIKQESSITPASNDIPNEDSFVITNPVTGQTEDTEIATNSSSIEKISSERMSLEVLPMIHVSTAEKQQIVKAQSASLGFQLTETETNSIANQVDDTFNSYLDLVNCVTTAIKGYIDHKFNEIEGNRSGG